MEGYSIAKLKEELLKRGLDTRGTKADLYIRLQDALPQENNKVDDSKPEKPQVNPEDCVSAVLRQSSRASKSQHIVVEAVNQAVLKLKASHVKEMLKLDDVHRLEEKYRLMQRKMLKIGNETQQAQIKDFFF